ncbi:ABC-2 transporter permease [Virgibacillus sp. 179-BFC.A HS]|uniref:ABC-2 transporter permease n=1 Tax=Tigheibacillus jepli TaxID=3035914 RepID=A0ABU5CJL6_9BACI|nr:ABC-2 transporter permease [Virgibacillus sp. 179-BFC.A HS]MDY0406500.1 ABC-2 transporter permease [Virgibacillus sp. 179-BFC.A HS]
MLHLIKKDIVIHKFSWIIYFALLVFFVALDKDVIFIIALISAIITMDAFYADDQANGHTLWNALPFTRSEVVSARYASLLVFTVISMGTVILVELIFKWDWEPSLWKEVIGSFILMVLSGALCFPIFYWLSSQRKVIFVLLILYILLVIAGTYAFYYLYLYLSESQIVPRTLSDGQLFGFAILTALCLYTLSWRLSIKIYRNREIV